MLFASITHSNSQLAYLTIGTFIACIACSVKSRLKYCNFVGSSYMIGSKVYPAVYPFSIDVAVDISHRMYSCKPFDLYDDSTHYSTFHHEQSVSQALVKLRTPYSDLLDKMRLHQALNRKIQLSWFESQSILGYISVYNSESSVDLFLMSLGLRMAFTSLCIKNNIKPRFVSFDPGTWNFVTSTVVYENFATRRR